MVARSSKKRAKYTYAERVLGALSDIQREHRKHAVHMATLRAHVRKMADARKDRIGPQWSQWVSRTVNRLADDGILDTSDSHGNVTFTPDAKKTIIRMRRESMNPGMALSPGLERKIWRNVTRKFHGVGQKRSRQSLSAVHTSAVDDDDWVDSDAPPRKRRAHHSLSSMTNVELESKLSAAFKELYDAQGSRPVNTEELSMLRELLADREKDIAALREELANLKDRPPIVDSPVTVGTSTALLNLPWANSLLPSSQRVRTGSYSHLLAIGDMRTPPGSLVFEASKQPTSVASSAGSQGSELQELNPDMEKVSSPALPEVSEEVFSRPPPTLGLVTPLSSPLFPDQEELDTGVHAASLSHESEASDALSEISALNNQLEAQSAEVKRLRDERLLLLTECDGSRAFVTDRDEHVQVPKSNVCSGFSESLPGGAELEQTLTREKERHRETQNALEASQSSLASEQQRSLAFEKGIAELRQENDDLREQVRSLGVHSDGLVKELEVAQCNVSAWRVAHQESEEKLKKTTVELANVKQQLRSAQEETQTSRKALERSGALLVERTADFERTLAVLASVQGELACAKLALDTSHTSELTLSARVAELELSLQEAQERTRSLTDAKSVLERASDDLHGTVEQLHKELAHAKVQLEAVREEAGRSQDVISALRASQARAAQEADALKTTASGLESTVNSLRSQLEDAAAQRADLRRSLEMEQASRTLAKSEVASSRAACDALSSDLADKTARLSATAEQLSTLRHAQSKLLSELEAVKEQRAEELAIHATEKVNLEVALETAQATAKDMKDRLDALRLSDILQDLASVVAEKDQLCAELQEAHRHSAELEADLRIARHDVEQAEEEIDELRRAKAEDEASIQNLKAGLARLRQLQLDALSEVDSKMVSAHSAPTPGSRRRSSIAPHLNPDTRR
ncbi:hypothetical protein BD414DRAFT_255072 [Trametes punicea]|nr:hypothetical protein BD414DRAFT_255072 [Trametes punicea]